MPIGIWGALIQSTILLAGVVDDLKTRKVHNWLVLVLVIFALSTTLYFYGLEGLKLSALSALVALGLSLPLTLSHIMGAGDMKLLIAFSFASAPMTVVWVFIYSFIWGALLGLIRVLISKEGKQLLQNTLSILTRKEVEKTKLHKIPFTIALFFGWLTQLSLNGFTGGVL